MILPKIRDKQLITIRRGGKLTDERHRLLAPWTAKCHGKLRWRLMTMGRNFVALPAKVQKSNKIRLGDSVTAEFIRRDRENANIKDAGFSDLV
jgi:hypothetical protein